MNPQEILITVVLVLLLAKVGVEIFLSFLNQKEVEKHRESPPEPLREVMNEKTYDKACRYTLAKSKFGIFGEVYGLVLLLVVLFSGVLPWFYSAIGGGADTTIWRESFFLIAVMMLLGIPSLPLEWYSQFRLEERFGFNKSSLGLWITDKIKGLVIGLVLGVPLVTLLLFLVTWAGSTWWIWGFLLVFIFQLVLMVVYPMWILPWFNKLTPLPEGNLRDRLMALADRTGFKAQTIQVMDGSKRSGHSNAFFTGFGRFRRIVLFDTLVEQLEEDELESVLAHEIGHYKRGHIPKMLGLSSLMLLASFAVLAWLIETPVFVEAFGFDAGNVGVGPAFLLFALLAGVFTFWLTPLFNILSRKHEYEADDFAREHAEGRDPMIRALRKLSEKNLSNLTPHPLFSGFYYSHPTLLERESSLGKEG
ncbi:MAG: M48 family metallopeptidase [Opitutales bacterium]|nr:M48 family metallopeptidase [Opitutales bacterium]